MYAKHWREVADCRGVFRTQWKMFDWVLNIPLDRGIEWFHP